MNEFEALFRRAVNAGVEAAEAITPRPMAVQAGGLTGDFNWNKPYEVVMDGCCGFAWINIVPASAAGRKDCPFVKWLRAKAGTERFSEFGRYEEYSKAWQIWVRGYGQSMQRKEVWAQAFADVLRDAGVSAYAGSKMD